MRGVKLCEGLRILKTSATLLSFVFLIVFASLTTSAPAFAATASYDVCTTGPISANIGDVVTLTNTQICGTGDASGYTNVASATWGPEPSFDLILTITSPGSGSATWGGTIVTITVASSPPEFTAISPAAGTVSGGTTVTITGNNFNTVAGNNTVKFGTSNATVTAASATSLTVTTPSRSAGTVDVSVTNVSTGLTGTAAGAYTYRKPPQIYSQPSDKTVNAGGNATFNVTAFSASGYEWYYNAGAGFLPVSNGGVYSGTTTSTLTITGATLAMNGYMYRVVVRDSYGLTTTSTARTLTVNQVAPVANAVSATIAANSSNNPITLAITGGAADSVAVGTQAIHGTATASGTTITYTPNAGYSGADSFTYAATNAVGTSAPATVSVTITAPTMVISPPSLPDGKVGMVYDQTITAAGGTAPYSFAVTSGALPAGLTLSPLGALAGTPTANGTFAFTITANDSFGATRSLAYDLQIERKPNMLVFTPASGALREAMAGEDYSAPISSSGGVDPVVYSIASGALPDGLVLNVSTGELNGTLDAGTEGSYAFTVQATDTNSDTGTASYTLVVVEREIAVTDKEVTVPPGATPVNVDLATGATGGPFVDADIVSVEPPGAGTVSIVRGEFAAAGPVGPLGWYLKFIPNPAYSGQAVVRFRLTSALGVSNTGTVTYALGYDAGEVAADMDTLVHGFVQSRQNLISSTIEVPGLIERRQMSNATDPVTGSLRPTANGITTTLSTSLVQMEVAANDANGLVEAELSPFNIWIDSTFMLHNREQNEDDWGSFGMVSAGADYLLNEKALIGLSVHYDRTTDPTDADAELTGNGWLAGPYASFEPVEGVFWDTSLLFGGSSNTIDTEFWDGSFDTRRWLFDTAISGQWQLDEATTLTPRLRTVYFSETVADYAVENGTGDVLDIGGFTAEQLRVSLGAEVARQFRLGNSLTLIPKFGLSGGFSGLDGSGAFGQVSVGLALQTMDAWSMDAGLLFNIEGGAQTSAGAKFGVTGRF